MQPFRNFTVGAAYVWAFLFPSLAAADPISIRTGVIELGERFTARPFALTGDRGFSLSGVIGNRGLDPVCGGTADFSCPPGEAASLDLQWGGLDFTGVDATLDGVSYPDINTATSDAFASIELAGGVVLPASVTGTAMLEAPFSMEGLFTWITPEGEFLSEALLGGGLMTTTWTPLNDPELGGPRWTLASSRFEFQDPAPIPEPATLLLTGTGAAAAALRHRRRRRSGGVAA